MACEDLRHVCGGCGFKWPERSAYDELTFENVRLRDELAAERAKARSCPVVGDIVERNGHVGAIVEVTIRLAGESSP